MPLKPNIKSAIDRAKPELRAIEPVPNIGLESEDVQSLAEELKENINQLSEETDGVKNGLSYLDVYRLSRDN